MPRKSRVSDHQKHDFFHLMKKYNYKTTKDMVIIQNILDLYLKRKSSRSL